LDELRITLLTSPDGKVKLYSWHDGDFGNAFSFHTIYQTKSNGSLKNKMRKRLFSIFNT